VPTTEERKVVTVLFADVTGSTELAARLDPERFREVMGAFFLATTEEMESLRGRVENFAGDAVLGVFGLPHAHDDDALRAVRAALSIVDRTARLGESFGLPTPLQVRVGVNTGQVAVGKGLIDEHHLAGATVNLAARLQSAAEPGEVLVGETTWQLTREQVEFGPVREIAAKGFEGAVRARPVKALAPRSARRTIPFVDRKRELRLLRDTFERAQETERGHMVTLLGEAGIGKSRVAEEFLAGLPGETKVLVGRASPFEEKVTFAPLAQMLLAEMGERPDAPSERLMARLEAVVLSCCPQDQTQQVVARLAPALGLRDGSRGEGRYRVAEIRSGLLTFLAGIAKDGPVVMVFEDAHLAQPSLLDLVEQVVREARGIPLLVLCVARYDLLDERPDWGGGLGDSLNLYLEPMSLPDAVQLALAAGEGLDQDTAEAVARHAGGNPFFIVKTTGMLLHEEVGMPPEGGLPGRLLPPTVQAVVAARIDHLPEGARDLVRKASVFARATFDVSELAIIADPDEETLRLLEDEELLVQDEERPEVWRFRHGLLRDVAYESLPKRERQRLHLRIADRLSEPDLAAVYPRSIAYHLEQAARAALDLDPKDRTLADRAVDALERAGDQYESGTAADLYERALSLAGPERSWGRREAAILSKLGEARYWLGEFVSAEGPLSRALELAGDQAWVRAHASRFLGDIALSVHGDRVRGAVLLTQALAAARQLGEPRTLARTLLTAGWAPYWEGDLETARAMFEEALAVTRANREPDPWGEARALGTLATIASPAGDEEECLALAREALAIGERTGDAFTVAVAKESLGNSLRRMWRLEEARPMLDDAARGFRELRARWELASSLTSRGVLRRLMGELPGAEADLREALRMILRELKERSLVGWTASQLAVVLLARDEVEAAREVLDDAAVQAGAEPLDVLAARSLLALAEGDRDTALSRALELLSLERERGWPNELAATTWWAGRVFGPDAVGGEEETEGARKVLEAHHWEQALREPDLMRG